MGTKALPRTKAQALYVQKAMPLPAIAKKLGVSERTLARWKQQDAANGEDWDKARVAPMLLKENVEVASMEFLQAFLQYHQDAFEDIKTDKELSIQDKAALITSLADAYTKTVKACSLTAPTLSQLAIALDVLRKLIDFVNEKHPDAAPHLLVVLDPFGAELKKHYG